MKKIFFAALLAVTMGTSSFANETNNENYFIRKNFNTEFKGASNVTWTSVEGFSKAAFMLNNQKMEAFYNVSGEIVGTSKSITIEELPVGAKRIFAKKFDGYSVKEAIYFQGAEETSYYVSAENDSESVIIKIDQFNLVSIVKNIKK